MQLCRKGVESIQDNVLSAEPIQIESNDEFEEFAAAFNKMTGIIQKQMREIEENRRYQRAPCRNGNQNLKCSVNCKEVIWIFCSPG